MWWNALMNLIFDTYNESDEDDDTVDYDDDDDDEGTTIYEHTNLFGIDLLA